MWDQQRWRWDRVLAVDRAVRAILRLVRGGCEPASLAGTQGLAAPPSFCYTYSYHVRVPTCWMPHQLLSSRRQLSAAPPPRRIRFELP